MTGKEQKVYYSYSQITQKHDIPDDVQSLGKDAKSEGFSLPELEHNLELLIEMTEQEIIQNDRQLQYEKDMVINISHENEKLSEVLEHEGKIIDKLSHILQIVEDCEKRLQPSCENPLTLEECANIFEMLQEKYFEEYKMFDLAELSIAVVFPLLREYFKAWNPLQVQTNSI